MDKYKISTEVENKFPSIFEQFKKYYTDEVLSLMTRYTKKNYCGEGKECFSIFSDDGFSLCQILTFVLLKNGLEDAVLYKNSRMIRINQETEEKIKDLIKQLDKAKSIFDSINIYHKEILEYATNFTDRVKTITENTKKYDTDLKQNSKQSIYLNYLEMLVWSYLDEIYYISYEKFKFLCELLSILIYSIKSINDIYPSLSETRKGISRIKKIVWEDIKRRGHTDINASLKKSIKYY